MCVYVQVGKQTKIGALQARARRLCAELERQAAWVRTRRDAADFAPSDEAACTAFEARLREARAGPFSALLLLSHVH